MKYIVQNIASLSKKCDVLSDVFRSCFDADLYADIEDFVPILCRFLHKKVVINSSDFFNRPLAPENPLTPATPFGTPTRTICAERLTYAANKALSSCRSSQTQLGVGIMKPSHSSASLDLHCRGTPEPRKASALAKLLRKVPSCSKKALALSS